MAPFQDLSTDRTGQPPIRRGRSRRLAPRRRLCLLKGCGRRFRPEHPLARYCGPECRHQARRWGQWKASRKYRRSETGKRVRQAQSRRYRIRRRERRHCLPTEDQPGARAIPIGIICGVLRSTGMLPGVQPDPPLAAAPILLPGVSERSASGREAGKEMAGKRVWI
jgi:hypothetical protein